jgi:hypothetical protein
MPSIVGNIKIVNVSSSSFVLIGDPVVLATVSTSKSYAGSGSFNKGDHLTINNGVSSTNTIIKIYS